MAEAEHTPGPWEWIGGPAGYPDGRKLLTGPNRAVIHCPDAPMGVSEADQHLIAAAPDLLEALEVAKNTVECASIDVRTGEELPWYRMAKAAIARARGAKTEPSR